VIAANRDEYFARPAEGPAVRETSDGPVVAPRDLQAGGTWLGLNRGGVFAAVTNRPCAESDRSRRSRGLVVMDALGAASAEAAARDLASLPTDTYNPFNAFVADGQRAFAMVYEDAPRLIELDPGAHVIGNADPDSHSHPKVSHVLERAVKASDLPRERVLDELAGICCEHQLGGASIGDTCVHLEQYGTRSSLLLLLGDDARHSQLFYADGPPCANEYDDHTSLLQELRR